VGGVRAPLIACVLWCLLASACAFGDDRSVGPGEAARLREELVARGWSARILATPVETPARLPSEPGPFAGMATLGGEELTLAEVLYRGVSQEHLVPASGRYDAEYDLFYLQLLSPTGTPIEVILKDDAGVLRLQWLASPSGTEVGWGASDAFWGLFGRPRSP
jgi:hypothetical protein